MDIPEDNIGIVIPLTAAKTIFSLLAEAYLHQTGKIAKLPNSWTEDAEVITEVLMQIIGAAEDARKGGGGPDPRMN